MSSLNVRLMIFRYLFVNSNLHFAKIQNLDLTSRNSVDFKNAFHTLTADPLSMLDQCRY